MKCKFFLRTIFSRKFPSLVTRVVGPKTHSPTGVDEFLAKESNGRNVSTQAASNGTIIAPSLNEFPASPITASNLPSPTTELTAEKKRSSQKTFLSKNARLFRKFAFKGFGVHFSKSAFDWHGVAFGVKIPITQNFPVYDSLIFLPRVNALVAVNYPFSFRISFSISVPMQVLTFVLLNLLLQGKLLSLAKTSSGSSQSQSGKSPANALPTTLSGGSTTGALNVAFNAASGNQLASTAASQKSAVVWPTIRSSDSVTRVGMTVAYRYSKSLGHHSVIGPNVLYLPGLKMIQRLLPLIIVFPALAMGILLWLMGEIYDHFLRFIVAAAKSRSPHANLHQMGDQFNQPQSLQNQAASSTNSRKRLVGSTADAFSTVYSAIEQWMLLKSPSFGAQLGYYDTGHVLAMGSSLYLEMQPFFPLQRQWRAFTSAFSFGSSKKKVPSSTSEAAVSLSSAPGSYPVLVTGTSGISSGFSSSVMKNQQQQLSSQPSVALDKESTPVAAVAMNPYPN